MSTVYGTQNCRQSRLHSNSSVENGVCFNSWRTRKVHAAASVQTFQYLKRDRKVLQIVKYFPKFVWFFLALAAKKAQLIWHQNRFKTNNVASKKVNPTKSATILKGPETKFFQSVSMYDGVQHGHNFLLNFDSFGYFT